eukprot:scaffold31593_cov56-Phaeocystis_antarctica.AAC.1
MRPGHPSAVLPGGALSNLWMHGGAPALQCALGTPRLYLRGGSLDDSVQSFCAGPSMRAPLGCTPGGCPEQSLEAWRCARPSMCSGHPPVVPPGGALGDLLMIRCNHFSPALQCAPGTPRLYSRGVP